MAVKVKGVFAVEPRGIAGGSKVGLAQVWHHPSMTSAQTPFASIAFAASDYRSQIDKNSLRPDIRHIFIPTQCYCYGEGELERS